MTYNVLKKEYTNEGSYAMQFDNYLIYLDKTMKENSQKINSYLIKLFLKENVIEKKTSGKLFLKDKQVDISQYDTASQISYCMKHSKEACQIYEKWEFEKDYKYSVLFECDNFDDLLERVKSVTVLGDKCEEEYVFTTFSSPVSYQSEEYAMLKFNLLYSAMHPITQEENLLKYPFVVVLHKEYKIVEFRFDALKPIFRMGEHQTDVYSALINNMLNYLQQNYSCELKAYNLDFMVNIARNEEDVKLIAQFMKLPKGGNAQLDVGNNEEYVIPLIGELRGLLATHQMELEKVPSLREALEVFMFEMEEMSDYPWIEVLWENEVKTRGIQVKFIFNYMNREYCLLQHYYSSVRIGMERMNYVVKYIIDHRNGLEE